MIRCENCHERFYSPEEHHSLSGCQKKTIKSLRTKTARLEADLRADREEAAGLRATAFELRKIIVDSANVCTLKGCEHCKWLGFNLGRYESLAALAPAEPAPSSGADA